MTLAERATRLEVGLTPSQVNKLLGREPEAIERGAAGYVAAGWRESGVSGWIAASFEHGVLTNWCHIIRPE
jgi:hypothetical protein